MHFGRDVIGGRLRSRGEGRLNVLTAIIAAAEILLQPDVQADEQIPAAHFLDLQLRDAGPAVAPGDRHHRPGVAAHDGLERQLDGEIEMRRQMSGRQPSITVAAVGLEGVGRVVERMLKQHVG